MNMEQKNASFIPSYDGLIEEEEEMITLDFNNKTIYKKEEHIASRIPDQPFTIDSSVGVICEEPHANERSADYSLRRPAADTSEINAEEKSTFQTELNNLLVDTITSKALASLLMKQRAVADEVEKTIQEKRLGELTELIDTEVYKVMDKRRQEIRSCFVGGDVRYEVIPSWARSYIKEYMKDMIHGLAVLTEDGE